MILFLLKIKMKIYYLIFKDKPYYNNNNIIKNYHEYIKYPLIIQPRTIQIKDTSLTLSEISKK